MAKVGRHVVESIMADSFFCHRIAWWQCVKRRTLTRCSIKPSAPSQANVVAAQHARAYILSLLHSICLRDAYRALPQVGARNSLLPAETYNPVCCDSAMVHALGTLTDAHHLEASGQGRAPVMILNPVTPLYRQHMYMYFACTSVHAHIS